MSAHVKARNNHPYLKETDAISNQVTPDNFSGINAWDVLKAHVDSGQEFPRIDNQGRLVLSELGPDTLEIMSTLSSVLLPRSIFERAWNHLQHSGTLTKDDISSYFDQDPILLLSILATFRNTSFVLFPNPSIFRNDHLFDRPNLKRIFGVPRNKGIEYRKKDKTGTELYHLIFVDSSIERGYNQFAYKNHWMGDIFFYSGEEKKGEYDLTGGNAYLARNVATNFPMYGFRKLKDNEYQYMGRFRTKAYSWEERENGLNSILVFQLQLTTEPPGFGVAPGFMPPPLPSFDKQVTGFQTTLTNTGLSIPEPLSRSFLTALATKRFAILTGLSGSGKTQLAKKLGDWFGPKRSKLIPVRPDWTGPEHLLGYDDTLAGPGTYFAPPVLQFLIQAKENPHYPHLLILDEMNLAHVERYFADILSGMESGDPVLPNVATTDGERYTRVPNQDKLIPLPTNLFIVGTVNVDETTYMFSPKVLDRANTFEFRVAKDDLDAARQRPQKGEQGDDALVRGFLAIAQTDAYKEAPDQAEFAEQLKILHQLLAANDWEFGFRVYYEANRFAALLAAAGDEALESALDAQVMQKILPRLHGNRRRLEATLCALGIYCLTLTYDKAMSDQEQIKQYNTLDEERKKLPEEKRSVAALRTSYDKVTRMLRNLRANQFASFTE